MQLRLQLSVFILLFSTLLSRSLYGAEAVHPHEDGWAGNETSILLTQYSEVASLTINGSIPNLNPQPFNQSLTVAIDDKVLSTFELAPGNFQISAISVGSPGPKLVSLRFSTTRPLPSPDNRLVGGHFSLVSLDPLHHSSNRWPASSNKNDIIRTVGPVALGLGWFPPETFAGETFRWISHKAELAVMPNQPIRLSITAEPGPSLDGQLCTLRVTDRTGSLLDKLTVPGRGTIELSLPPQKSSSLPLTMEITTPSKPIPGDGRILSLRIFSISAHIE